MMVKKVKNKGYTCLYKKLGFSSKLKGTPSFLWYRLKWALAGRRIFLSTFPLHLDIELTNVCNLSCPMCFQKYMKGSKGFMSWELYKKIIDEGADSGLQAVKLQVRGESFLHPDLLRCIRYAKEKGIKDIQITTNATLLDKKTIPELIDSGLDVIIFSLDTNHRISYENGGKRSYEEVISNIHDFIKLRDERGYKRPLTRLQFSLEPGENPEEIASQFGSIQDQVDWAFANEIFYVKEDGNPIDMNKFDFLPCNILWQRMVVHYNGDCTVCCRDYSCELKLGNADQQTIKEIWNGPQMKKIRLTHSQGRRSEIPICKFCDLYLIEKK